MGMTAGSFASRVVATAVVATDGTGDFTDIQTAIDSLPAGGGVVYIKEGDYPITAKITITSANISIFGAGKSTRIHTTANIRMIEVNGGSYFTLRDLYLYGSGSGNGNNRAFVLVSGANIIIENVLVENVGSSGIYFLAASNDSVVRGCVVNTPLEYGIFFGGNKGIIVNNVVTSSSLYGIWVLNGDETIVQGNKIKSCSWDGILIESSDKGAIVGNVSVNNGRSGVAFENASSKCAITGNICNDNSSYGVELDSGCNNNVVTSNTLINNTSGAYKDSGTATEIGHNQQ